MTKGQRYALGYHLSEYPKRRGYKWVIEQLESGKFNMPGEDDILVWDVFEHMSGPDLADAINLTAEQIDKLIPKPRCIRIEISRGVLTNVAGLPRGWSYKLIDHDELIDHDDLEASCRKN